MKASEKRKLYSWRRLISLSPSTNCVPIMVTHSWCEWILFGEGLCWLSALSESVITSDDCALRHTSFRDPGILMTLPNLFHLFWTKCEERRWKGRGAAAEGKMLLQKYNYWGIFKVKKGTVSFIYCLKIIWIINKETSCLRHWYQITKW